MREGITIVSVGRHTRLGDVLERAVRLHPFDTLNASELTGGGWAGRRLLFAATFGDDEQTELASLIGRMRGGKCDLSGSACAAVMDAGQSVGAHTELLRLLFAANGAGAALVKRPCVEANRDLRSIPATYGAGRGSLFERFCALAETLAGRLAAFDPPEADAGVRIALPLENAAVAGDWRGALTREFASRGVKLCETENESAERTFLLCENVSGLPDDKTLAVLDDPRGGGLRAAVASPRLGAELYALLALDRACLQGKYILEPKAFALLEGVSAAEALAGKAEFERVRETASRPAFETPNEPGV